MWFWKTACDSEKINLRGAPDMQDSWLTLKFYRLGGVKVWTEVHVNSHRGAVQHNRPGLSSGQAWVASWGLLFLLPQSRLEKISLRLAGNHPYHTRKRQQYWEFNDRSNCCGSPTLCCGGVMNDDCNAPRCEEIVAAWLLFESICYGCNFSSRVV